MRVPEIEGHWMPWEDIVDSISVLKKFKSQSEPFQAGLSWKTHSWLAELSNSEGLPFNFKLQFKTGAEP